MKDLNEIRAEARTGGVFEGTISVKNLLDRNDGAETMKAAVVTFPPGVRAKIIHK
jgi:hypothetical protein